MPRFPDRSEDLGAWVLSLSADELREAVRDRLSVTNPETGERRPGRYITEEDITTLFVYLRSGARVQQVAPRGRLTWEGYLEEERKILEMANLRMGMATGAVQQREAENGGYYHESTIPIESIDGEKAHYLLTGPLAATIRDDGQTVSYRLHSFEGSFPVANAIYTMPKTGDVDLHGTVDKSQGADWRAAQSIVFWEFDQLYRAGDEKVCEVVAHVLGART